MPHHDSPTTAETRQQPHDSSPTTAETRLIASLRGINWVFPGD
ncbi:MAG: hypothetical protein SFY66_24535 [Oculatellaceae cyanobacterium bins.114]|nr:hypothetical protein [Oculatellaceae cyanobacterium bins.114]